MKKQTKQPESTTQDINEIIAELKQKEIELPKWKGKLDKEYYPENHEVMNTATYQDKTGKAGPVKVTRATRGLQKRAVKIMTGMMFGIPVKRIYTYKNDKDEKEIKAAAIIEEIYKANRIDSVNIQRGIKYFASCEIATLWYAIREDNTVYGEKGLLKIKCRTLSPMDDEEIYPIFDEYGDLVSLSFEYTRKEGTKTVTYFDSYTATTHHKWRQEDGEWELKEDDKLESISKIPSAYAHRLRPIWENSNNVTEIEWAVSRNGNYLRRNAVPVFEIATDGKIKFGGENESDERIVLHTPQGTQSGYKVWPQVIESLKFQIDQLERAFFSDIQIPNFSDSELQGGQQSGEAKRYWFVEAIIKVLEEKGPLLEFLSREFNVLIAFAKISFPHYAEAFDTLRCEHIITPFELSNEKDTINNASTAVTAGIASKETAVKRLSWVKDVDEEMKRIAADKLTDVSEPTF